MPSGCCSRARLAHRGGGAAQRGADARRTGAAGGSAARPNRRCRRSGAGSDPEHEAERVVDGADFGSVEPPGRRSEPLRVDDRRLLGEHSGLAGPKRHEWTKARRTRARRGRRDENRAQPEELICLHHDRIPRTALLMPPRREAPAAGRPRRGPSLRRRGSELRHLLPNQPHLLAILGIGRKTTNLLSDRTRRRAAASRNAIRTAAESLRPLERTTSSAAAELPSRRTWRERAATISA